MEEPKDETLDITNENATGQASDTKDAIAEAKRLSRRRTKTGCLTCRKRRIKCGEEHPTCKNCIKSKRECEGYKQPVVFRHPTGEYQPFEYSSNSNHFVPPYGGPPPGSLPQLAAANGSTHHGFDHAWSQPFPESNPERWAYDHPGHTNPLETSDHYIGATWSGNSRDTRRLEQNPSNVQNTSRYTWHSSATQADFAGPSPSSAASAHYPEAHYWSAPQTALPAYHGQYSFHPQYTHASGTGEPAPGFQPASTSTLHGEIPLVTSSTTVKHEILTPIDDDEKRYNPFGFIQQTSFGVAMPAAQSRTPPKSTPALPPDEEDDEEDPWDVELDFADPYSVPLTQSQHDLDSMLVKFNSNNERRARTFTSFLNGPSILATYRPSISASPLNDEKVARIFCHFISVTGPCISIFERQASPSTTLSGSTPIPAPQKTLWSYTLPSIALHHPALLHAMLALSALHISKLQDTPEDPAIKHYTYAVRRIGKLLGLPRRRHEAATLAANLLVGFYEVMASDHSRWSVHLAGAKVLVTEIDFATMARTIRGMRSRARQNLAGRPIMSYEEYEEWLQRVGIPESLLDDKDWEIDQDLISKLTGYHIEYDRQYQPNYPPKGHPRDLTAKEIDDYKIKSDLHWWYAKQDVFQSMVSGDVLLMPYRRWIYCPPRGQIGRPDAAYATMDHLVLIMARLTDFGGRDRVRKVKMLKSRGGQWRPPAHFYGLNNPPPTPTVLTPESNPSTQAPSSSHQNGSASKNGLHHGPKPPPSSGPGFYGMMPHSTDPVEMHSAFYKMHANIHDQAFHDPVHDEGSVHSSSSQTLEDDTAAAFKEHAEIIKSFKLFFDSLGEDYQPLAVDACDPISTPFGQALQYRTYAIACVWAFYYVGLILIERFHPDMPPAAMVAAGVTAHRTKENAQNVGRICAGLYYSQQQSLQTGNLNPGLGAALMESTFFLFFAAVNYQDAGQRGWTISKLRDIAQKTGWQTSAAVAAACEVSWEKLGEAGRGPVYKTTMDRNNTDLRVRRKNKLGDGSTKEEEDDKSAGPGLPTYNRKAIHTNQSTRVHWALGLLSVEKDIEQLNLDKKKMSAATSPRGIDGPSYFTTVHQRVVPELDTPSVSPSSHPPPTPPRPNRLLRPPVRPHSKARSEDISGYSRSTVQSIPEDEASQNRTLRSFIETPPYKGSRTSALTSKLDGENSLQQRAPQSIATSQSSSSFASVRSIARRYLQRFNSTLQQHLTTPISTTKSGPGHRRVRSESGRKRARSSTSLPRRKTRSAENLARRRFRNSSESHRDTSSAPPAPLGPPVSQNFRERAPADHHEIKIETPFTPHNKDNSKLPVCGEQQSSRRSSSVHPRVIFSTPLSIVRRFRKPPDTRPTLSSQRSSSPSVPEAHRIMLSHMSQLRPKRTHEALRQVSQLLRLIAGDKPDALAGEHKPATTRTMSNKSTPSIKELKEGRRLSRKPTQGLPPVPPRVPTQNSMELDLRGLDSSSIRMLRLGPPPNATPDEHATYKVKRSPSAETEEFLKVDISIRGGTSYLPSEARRIHTPPLPSEGADGRRRGFFFDYNAPRLRSMDEVKPNVGASTEGKPSVGPESGVGKGKAKSGEERPVSAGTTATVDRGTYRTLRTGKKNRGAEWYDTKLAELDTSTDEETLDKGNPGYDSVSSSFYEMRQRTERALLEMRTRHAKPSDSEVVAQADPADFQGQEVDDEEEEEGEEDEIDHNVPEHYPTSPLCPANVKYWRFVNGKLGKGRYTRTCWMHGDLQNEN